MNQAKVGKFISQCRKEKGVTQAQLAEKFSVSNTAVSKWENGKSLPDASIMIELCDFLGITVNELLSGERIIDMDEYKNKTEKNMLEMQKQLKSYKNRLIINNAFLLLTALTSTFVAPVALIAIIFVMVFRDYFLLKNMTAVKKVIEGTKA